MDDLQKGEQLFRLLYKAVRGGFGEGFYARVSLTADGRNADQTETLACLALYDNSVQNRFSFFARVEHPSLTPQKIAKRVQRLNMLPEDIEAQKNKVLHASGVTAETLEEAARVVAVSQTGDALPIGCVVYLRTIPDNAARIQWWYASKAPGEWLLSWFKRRAHEEYLQ